MTAVSVSRPPGRLVQKLARNLHEGWWVRLDGHWRMVEEVTLTARGVHLSFPDGVTRDLPLGSEHAVVIP
jgi:hypothetical protein